MVEFLTSEPAHASDHNDCLGSLYHPFSKLSLLNYCILITLLKYFFFMEITVYCPDWTAVVMFSSLDMIYN